MVPTYVYGESMVDEAGRFIWYCIPKNASRSLIEVLRRRGGRRIIDIAPGVPPREWLLATPPAFSFAFVRHPYSRMVSVWRNKIAAPSDTPHLALLFKRNHGLAKGMELDDFIDWIGSNYSTSGPDMHWRRQRDFVHNGQRLCVDLLGRVEDLAQDLGRVEDVLGPLGTPPRLNSSCPPQTLAADLLSARAKDIIWSIYGPDFELAGYDR